MNKIIRISSDNCFQANSLCGTATRNKNNFCKFIYNLTLVFRYTSVAAFGAADFLFVKNILVANGGGGVLKNSQSGHVRRSVIKTPKRPEVQRA